MLSRMARLLGLSTAETFRNANGVYMKMMNFRRLDPASLVRAEGPDAGQQG